MEGGEDFTLIDVRKPEAWEESDTMIPEAFDVARDFAGLITVAGFLAAFALSKLG